MEVEEILFIELCDCGNLGETNEEEGRCRQCEKRFYDNGNGEPRKGCILVEYTLTDKRFL